MERIEAEKQKVVVQQQKVDENSTKRESRRLEELRVAENRQKKKVEKRSKNQTVEDRVTLKVKEVSIISKRDKAIKN